MDNQDNVIIDILQMHLAKGIKYKSNYRSLSNIKMFSKVPVLFAILALACAERPYLGFRVPKFDLTQIVGGSEATKNSNPFILSLQWGLSENSLSHFCAATILDENWAVTAGHCIQAIPVGQGVFVAKAGKHDISTKEGSEQMVKIAKSFIHEKYGGDVGPYDIGLLKFSTPLKITKEVQTCGLPKTGNEPNGTPILTGWGSTSQGSFPIMPDKLQQVTLEYVDRKTCYESVLGLTGSSPVHETNVCTGPLTGGVSACSGDSGGPLFEKTSSAPCTLVGIVSWGIVPCGTRGAPSVYTKTSSHIEWMQNIRSKN